MPEFVIKNWTSSQALVVTQGGGHDAVPPIVTLVQREGSMHFQFGMSPEQACTLAGALLAFAADARQRKPEVVA